MVGRLLVFALGLVCASGAVVVAAPAAGEPAAPVAAGVSLYGVPVGGFTSEPVRRLLRERFAAPLTLTLGEESWRVRPSQLNASVSVDTAVAAALGAPARTRVPAEVEVDDARLESYVRWLARRIARPARDARLLGVDGTLRPRFSRASAGRELERRALAGALRRALIEGAREVAVPVRALAPQVTARTFGPVVVIRRDSNRLTLYDGREAVRRFTVATGAARFPTPLGTFTLVDKQYHPWWYPPASDWAKGLEPVPPGPGNPLGTRWMGLDVYGVGIHGTPDAASLGYSASHGCIRMAIPDAEWLFERVGIGMPVLIVAA